MVYYDGTLEVLHNLTDEGQENYRKLLEEKADEILFKQKHPLRYLIKKAKAVIQRKK